MRAETAIFPAAPYAEGEGKERKLIEKEIRRAEDFNGAVEKTLLNFYAAEKNESGEKILFKKEALEQSNLSLYERRLYEKETAPKINLLIDIDGVLIDTEEGIKNIAKILLQTWSLTEMKKAAEKSKIPFGTLKTLLQCRDKAEKIILVTDRFGVGPCYFPCFNISGQKMFEEHGIEVNANTFKPLSSGEKFVPVVAGGDITYYIGSSETDWKYDDKIRKQMEAQGIPQEKLVYLQAEREGKKNIL